MTERTFHITLPRNLTVSVCACRNILFVLCLCLLHRFTFTQKEKSSRKMLKSGEKICNDGRERRRDRWSLSEEGGRRVTAMGVGGVLLIVSHTRVVSQTDLHTRPRGTLGSVCLSLEARRVGGLSPTLHRLPVPVICFCLYPHLLSCCDSLLLFYSFLLFWFNLSLSLTY